MRKIQWELKRTLNAPSNIKSFDLGYGIATDEVANKGLNSEPLKRVFFYSRDYFALETRNNLKYNIVRGIYSDKQALLSVERTNEFFGRTGFTNQVYSGSTYFTWEVLQHYRMNDAREAFYNKWKALVNSPDGFTKFQQMAAADLINLTRFDTKWGSQILPGQAAQCNSWEPVK